jgi:AcrR family transcriptional regulator
VVVPPSEWYSGVSSSQYTLVIDILHNSHDDPGQPPVGEAPAPSRLARKKARTRAEIVRCASELFLSRGYEATSVQDITDLADISPATFYLHFSSKADVALTHFHGWLNELLSIVRDRPLAEPPDQMLVATLKELASRGYVSSQPPQDDRGNPVLPIAMAVLFAEQSAEVAGRIYQALVGAQRELASLFGDRLGLAAGSFEPWMIASGFIASWFAAVHGFMALVEDGGSSPSPDDLAVRTIDSFTAGLGRLWSEPD